MALFLNGKKLSSEPHNYSTNEQIVGTWIDGSTIYEKTFDLENDVVINYNAWTDMNISATGYNKYIGCFTINESGTYYPLMVSTQNSKIYCLACRSGSNVGGRYLTIQYTKSST